jgi:hypothetical protein
MRASGIACAIVISVATMSGLAIAADISRLEWGAFVVEDDNAEVQSEWKSVSSDDGNSITLSFTTLEARAEGSVTDSSSRVKGYYDVSQPSHDSFACCTVTLTGHVIKSDSATARIILTIGSEEKTVEWPAGQAASEKYTRTVDIVIPDRNRLPSPLAVGLQTVVHKEGQTDAAYVSIDSVTIDATTTKVAAQ